MHRKITCIGAVSLSVDAIATVGSYGIMRNASGETASPATIHSQAALMDFPEGTATSSELCGSCHQTIYKEHSEGLGSDLHWADMKSYPSSEPVVAILEGVSRGMARSVTAHAAAGNDPWALDAVKVDAIIPNRSNIQISMLWPSGGRSRVLPIRKRASPALRAI
jgi:hypothetical protein